MATRCSCIPVYPRDKKLTNADLYTSTPDAERKQAAYLPEKHGNVRCCILPVRTPQRAGGVFIIYGVRKAVCEKQDKELCCIGSLVAGIPPNFRSKESFYKVGEVRKKNGFNYWLHAAGMTKCLQKIGRKHLFQTHMHHCTAYYSAHTHTHLELLDNKWMSKIVSLIQQ